MRDKQKQYSRRSFVEKTALLGAAGLVAPGILKQSNAMSTRHMTHDDISLAQWALVQEIRDGKWKNLDFPRIAREDFGLSGIEFVNTLF